MWELFFIGRTGAKSNDSYTAKKGRVAVQPIKGKSVEPHDQEGEAPQPPQVELPLQAGSALVWGESVIEPANLEKIERKKENEKITKYQFLIHDNIFSKNLLV